MPKVYWTIYRRAFVAQHNELALTGGDPVRDVPISFAEPSISDKEIGLVSDVLKSGWLTTGEYTDQLEGEVSQYVGRNHGVGTVNCTSCLYMSFRALNISGEVITSPMTFASTVSSSLLAGCEPQLVDVRPDSLTLDPEALKDAVSSDTEAIVPVHYAGQAMDMNLILDLAEDHDAYVIEDAAHGLGAEFEGEPLGSLGDIGCFSFYATKPITTAEGGMAVTDENDVANTLRELRLAGVNKDVWERDKRNQKNWFYDVKHVSAKFNMNEVQAAIGVAQMEKLERFINQRRKLSEQLDDGIANICGIESLNVRNADEHGRHLYPVFIKESILGVDRDEFERALNAEGIETSVHYIPIHHHTAFEDLGHHSLSNANQAYEELLCLPLHPKMDEDDVEDILTSLRKVERNVSN